MLRLFCKKKLFASFLIMLMLFSMSTSLVFAGSFGATFNKSGELPGAITNPEKYYSTQGAAFDTYTKKDLYVATLNSLDKSKVQIARMTYANGKWTIVKKLVYSGKVLDHANDMTVFKQGNETYLFVAKGGKGNKTACMIKLSDFNKGKAKTYKVKFSGLDTKSGTDLRGITYCGKMKVKIGKKTVKKPVFVVCAGRRMNKMYLKSIKNNVATLVMVDSQRIQAPKYNGREGTAAGGVVYHKGNLFCVYADEGKGGENKTVMIEKMSMSKLFKIKNSNTAKKFDYSWSKTFDETFTPESLFFTSLGGKTNMFMTCNGGSGTNHKDYIYKSTQKF